MARRAGGGGSTASPPTTGIRIAELKREEPESPRIARFERDLRNLDAPARSSRCRSSTRSPTGPTQAIVGRVARRFAALAARALRRPDARAADARRAAADGRRRPGRRSTRRATSCTIGWSRSTGSRRRAATAGCSSARRIRRAAARSAWCSCPAWPSASFRSGRARIRCCSTSGARGARRGAGRPGRARQRRASAAEDRDRRRDASGSICRIRAWTSAETRARVPSFYALDVMRAITGRVPDHRVLAAEAAEEAGASLAWPAPRDPDRAIDDLEHDLAVAASRCSTRAIRRRSKGHAHYLLGLNEALRRSVISRWARGATGLVAERRPDPVDAGASRRRSTQQRLARAAVFAVGAAAVRACPYQFLLATIHRLEPWDEPEPLVRLDPLTRGSLFHKVQAEFYRALRGRGRAAGHARDASGERSRRSTTCSTASPPSTPRRWRPRSTASGTTRSTTCAAISASGCRSWPTKRTWVPDVLRVQLRPERRRPRSAQPAGAGRSSTAASSCADRSISIERHAELDVLRVTDHKTGKNRSNPDLIVGGGAVLQPVLYSLAVEQGLGKTVVAGPLVLLHDRRRLRRHTRSRSTTTRAVRASGARRSSTAPSSRASSPPRPAERACTWCDFRPVCGPREEERVKRKAKDRLADLEALRSMR